MRILLLLSNVRLTHHRGGAVTAPGQSERSLANAEELWMPPRDPDRGGFLYFPRGYNTADGGALEWSSRK